MKKSLDNHQASTSTAHSVNLQKSSNFLFYSVNFHMQYSHFLPAKYITHTHTLSSLDGSVPMYTQEVTNTKFQHLNELRNTTKASVRDIATDIINKIGLETVIL